MKHRDYLRWQPQFHWTDQKIKLHAFYCVLALLLATLARKVTWENVGEFSLPIPFDELSSIKEVARLYKSNEKLIPKLKEGKISSRQKDPSEISKIGVFLHPYGPYKMILRFPS